MNTENQSEKSPDKSGANTNDESAVAKARERLAKTGRNDLCPCGSGKKYKKCCLAADEGATAVVATAPNPQLLLANGWRLFEQRRPGAAEKEFRAALALKPDYPDADFGIGMAKLSAGDLEPAREALNKAVSAGETAASDLRAKNSKEGFTLPETQIYVRANHALGCLACDQDRYADAAVDFEKVYSIDEGVVGSESRLMAAKALIKLERAADAVTVLQTATASEEAAGRANLGLTLAHFLVGDKDAAAQSLKASLEKNPHFAKALLGRVRKQVENPGASAPGSVEEAVVYVKAYGDLWTDEAKKFVEETLTTSE